MTVVLNFRSLLILVCGFIIFVRGNCACTGGQEFYSCASACDRTCDNPNPICTIQCVPRCECPADAPILFNDDCVTPSACASSSSLNVPDCSGGKVFHICGNGCDRTCSNPYRVCSTKCIPRCQCPSHQPIFYEGLCIAIEDCSVFSDAMKCDGGKIYVSCGKLCKRTCQDPFPTCENDCTGKCECPDAAPIWNGTQCMQLQDCDSGAHGQPLKLMTCSGGQVFTTCGSICTPSCDSFNPVCSDTCVGRCQCPSSRPLLERGICISTIQCGMKCLGGMEVRSCASACNATCDNPKPVCTQACVKDGCQCPDNRPVWNGYCCVTADHCSVDDFNCDQYSVSNEARSNNSTKSSASQMSILICSWLVFVLLFLRTLTRIR